MRQSMETKSWASGLRNENEGGGCGKSVKGLRLKDMGWISNDGDS